MNKMKGIKNKVRQRWYLRWILFFSNWVAQGIINADKTEKTYKILFTLIFSVLFYVVLTINSYLSFKILVISVLYGHTLNWFINGSISTILLHRLFIGKLTKDTAFGYLQALKVKLASNDSIMVCAVFGSIARGGLKSSSDIDITFVRKPGFSNAVKSIFFVVKEKFYTNTHLIPIEPFLADSVSYMKKRYRDDEIPIIIKNNTSDFSKYYTQMQTIEEARILNNVK